MVAAWFGVLRYNQLRIERCTMHGLNSIILVMRLLQGKGSYRVLQVLLLLL